MRERSWTPIAGRAAWWLALGFFLAARTTAAAEPTPAPLEYLYEPANVLAAGTVLEADPAGQISFRIDNVLGGKARPVERLEVQVPPWTASAVRPDEKYLFGFALGLIRVLVDPDDERLDQVIVDLAKSVVGKAQQVHPSGRRCHPPQLVNGVVLDQRCEILAALLRDSTLG